MPEFSTIPATLLILSTLLTLAPPNLKTFMLILFIRVAKIGEQAGQVFLFL
jgi:hypothetical protein